MSSDALPFLKVFLGCVGIFVLALIIERITRPKHMPAKRTHRPQRWHQRDDDLITNERPMSYWMALVDGDLDGIPDEIEHWLD